MYAGARIYVTYNINYSGAYVLFDKYW